MLKKDQPREKDTIEKNDAEALYALALSYQENQNIEKANEFFKKAYTIYYRDTIAFRGGSSIDIGTGYYRLGCMLHWGQGVEINIPRARRYFEFASAKGDSRASNNLGCLYIRGDFGEQNILKAVEFFEKAVRQQGGERSLKNLASLYLPEGVEIGENFSEQLMAVAKEEDYQSIYDLGVKFTEFKSEEINKISITCFQYVAEKTKVQEKFKTLNEYAMKQLNQINGSFLALPSISKKITWDFYGSDSSNPSSTESDTLQVKAENSFKQTKK